MEGFGSHVLCEILKSRQVFGRTQAKLTAPIESRPSCFFGRPQFQKDTFAQVPNFLKRVVRSAAVLFRLLEEIIKKRPGDLERVGDIVARVFVNGLLSPWIELFRIKKVGLVQEDL